MPSVGTAIGTGVSLLGQRKAAKAQSAAADAQARQAELQYQRSLPYQTSGAFGDVAFEGEGADKTMKLNLSPELQAEYAAQMGDIGKQRAFISQYEADPFQAAEKYYQMQKQLYAPEQAEERLATEERLVAQGMFGSTGGAEQMRKLREAQQMQDMQTRAAAQDRVQQLIDTYRGRQATALGTAADIGQLPAKYAELAQGIAGVQQKAASSAADMASKAALSRGQSQASMALGMANKLGGLNWGGMFGSSTAPQQSPAMNQPMSALDRIQSSWRTS